VFTAGNIIARVRHNYLIQFYTHRKRWLRRLGSGWRQAVAFAVIFLCLYSVTLAAFQDKTQEASTIETAYVAPQPNVIDERVKAAMLSGGSAAPKPAAREVVPESMVASIEKNISSYLAPGKALAKKLTIGKGDTLMGILVNKGAVPKEDAYKAVLALNKVYDPRDLTPGREITVFFHRDPSIADRGFSGLRIEKDIVNAVTVKRDGNGDYKVNEVEKDVHRSLRAFRGTISSSLYEDAKAQGVPDAVIIELIKMYSWNVDFQRGIHTGDKFEVMYEEYKTEDEELVRGRGNVLYAQLTLDGEQMPFYRYTDRHGDTGYFDDGGQSAKKPLMKTPIDGARLSSGYGMRKHPVLGYTKMHKGVDFAAPRGTPIYAAGDGTVEKMGPYSSYGNYIRIRHRNNLKTAYAHMKGFKSGLRAGSRVKQGQIIGYVGTTGRSTGPHLHYEVLVNNRQANPNSVKLPTGIALKGKDLKAFKMLVAQTKGQFKDANSTTRVAAARTSR
jgi:murein DD-endopeptidase MepM/ murein hydrolase activator NlpD